MNGAPANPISGVAPSSPTRVCTDSVMKGTWSGVRSGIASTSASVVTGFATTGPTPGLMSRSTPTALSGSTMSEKKIAASTAYRRTGCMVISTTSSGRMHDSSIRDALAHLAVLRERPAGLPHEPHGRVRNRLAARRAQER